MARGTLGRAANDIRKLWDAGTVSGLSDAQLLERITANHDEHAFDALIARHGPLVWSVCRSILSDSHDVEDAFQASFLILVRKARSLRVGDSLCGWLYRVSYRVAQEARARRLKRQVRERSTVDEALVAADPERADDELLTILSREIDRLHEKYRLPIVLCRLKGVTHQEAALQLGWPPGTVGTRLARGLNLLQTRMRRRLGSKAGDQYGWLGAFTASSVPPTCQEATIRAAVSMVTSGEESAGWTPYVVALAQAVQTAVLRASLRSFVLFAVLDAEIFARPSAGDQPKARSIRGASFVLTTTPSRVIEGTVREQGTGQPIAGAMVNGLRTDHDGKFRIDGLSPEFILPLEVAGPVGAAYFQRKLTVESNGSDRRPMRVDVELCRGIVIRGRVIDSGSGRPVAGRVLYAPLKGNRNLAEPLGEFQNSQELDDHGEFAVVGMPGPGAVVFTVDEGEILYYPRDRKSVV